MVTRWWLPVCQRILLSSARWVRVVMVTRWWLPVCQSPAIISQVGKCCHGYEMGVGGGGYLFATESCYYQSGGLTVLFGWEELSSLQVGGYLCVRESCCQQSVGLAVLFGGLPVCQRVLLSLPSGGWVFPFILLARNVISTSWGLPVQQRVM